MNPVASDRSGDLTVTARPVDTSVLLTVCGLLDNRTYRGLRDRIVKAALDGPQAVLVDVGRLEVPAASAWAVFTSARWLVNTWPDVPIALVCDSVATRSAIRRNGITRYVPVFPSAGTALDALAADDPQRRRRRRARAHLPAQPASLPRARALTAQWLSDWSREDFVPAAKVVVTALVENALMHSRGAFDLRLETDGTTVTVAVSDGSPAPGVLREDSGTGPTGLRIVAALCRTWGNAPTPSGKTVWVVIGPENRL